MLVASAPACVVMSRAGDLPGVWAGLAALMALRSALGLARVLSSTGPFNALRSARALQGAAKELEAADVVLHPSPPPPPPPPSGSGESAVLDLVLYRGLGGPARGAAEPLPRLVPRGLQQGLVAGFSADSSSGQHFPLEDPERTSVATLAGVGQGDGGLLLAPHQSLTGQRTELESGFALSPNPPLPPEAKAGC
mmetsp:Transcript_50056/g.113628  ORF Transcript_50056/g.113628 Transcript_50056/m.113628 type:complete len:194 (+) Transcript_50056:473-1054(+)